MIKTDNFCKVSIKHNYYVTPVQNRPPQNAEHFSSLHNAHHRSDSALHIKLELFVDYSLRQGGLCDTLSLSASRLMQKLLNKSSSKFYRTVGGLSDKEELIKFWHSSGSGCLRENF